jgi:hypothetical protein
MRREIETITDRETSVKVSVQMLVWPARELPG